MPLKVLDLTKDGSLGVLGLQAKRKKCKIDNGWYLQWGKWLQVTLKLKSKDVEIKSIKDWPYNEFKVCVLSQ